MTQLNPRKNQKCYLCKKPIKKEWCYNGYWWHGKCKDKATKGKIEEYYKGAEIKK